MVYLIGFLGLLAGFLAGQSIVYYLLSDTPSEEIQNNKKLKLQYGLLNWAFALLGAVMAVLFFT